MEENEMRDKQIEAFIDPLKELLKKQSGKNIIVVGVGEENYELAEKIYDLMDGSATSEIVTRNGVPTLNACLFAGEPDIVIIVTNSKRENEESSAAGLAVGLIKTKTGHTSIVEAAPGSKVPSTNTLASKAIIVTTDGPLKLEIMNKVGGGVVDFGALDSSKKFAEGLSKIVGEKNN